MAVWGQSVVRRGVVVLTNWDEVPLIDHKVDPGYYAVFARIMVGSWGGPTEWEHAAFAQLNVGSEKDETYGRLLVAESSGGDAVKGSTPISLMVVSNPNEEADRIRLVARGSGAILDEARLTIIALDEVRPPVSLGEEGDAIGVHYRDYAREVFVPGSPSEPTPTEGTRSSP
jgi:hypothetical protein